MLCENGFYATARIVGDQGTSNVPPSEPCEQFDRTGNQLPVSRALGFRRVKQFEAASSSLRRDGSKLIENGHPVLRQSKACANGQEVDAGIVNRPVHIEQHTDLIHDVSLSAGMTDESLRSPN